MPMFSAHFAMYKELFMKVFFHTLGCKVNQYETEYLLLRLKGAGFICTEQAETAEMIVVNSCTVTAESDRKTRQLVRRYRRLNPSAVLVLTGCMPQVFPKEAAELPADIVLGNGSERDILQAVDAYFKTHERQISVLPHKKSEAFESGGVESFHERTRAYMKVEDGCDRGCTYCIIPKARGRVRSRPLTEITAEAERLAKAGFQELVLVGINLSSYGVDTGHTLADAVRAAAGPQGIQRIRLGSLEPDLTDETLLSSLREIPEFCPQFHLSLQAGCDATLKRMNRLYDADFYRRLVKQIRSLWSNASITTDIMVGFVGESEDEFAQSVAFVKEIGFLKAHIFPYSVRIGTAAAQMKGHIDEAIKTKRAAEMATLCEEITQKILQGLVGQKRTVLFEQANGEFIEGYSEDYIRVLLPRQKAQPGQMKQVTLKAVGKESMWAE